MTESSLNQDTSFSTQTEVSQSPSAGDTGVKVHSMNTNENVISQDGQTAMKGSMSAKTPLFLFLCLVILLAGVWTGKGLTQLTQAKTPQETFNGQKIQKVAGDSIQNGQIFGSTDEKSFPDAAEGYLEIGGVDNEGTHKLLRAGGASQTVYLNSSVTDLDKFNGMNVKVWGETNKGQKAGWLMDVGRVQIVETKGTAPLNK